MFNIYWNSNRQCFETEINDKLLTVYPEMVGYTDQRASIKFNYDHTDYEWSFVDGNEKLFINGNRKYNRHDQEYVHVPHWWIEELSRADRKILIEALASGINKGRSKYIADDLGYIRPRTSD